MLTVPLSARLALGGCILAIGLSAHPIRAESSPMSADPQPSQSVTTTTPPSADRKLHSIEQVGRTRSDPYFWLKDPNWQTVMQEPDTLDPEIRAYLEAENAFTDALLDQPTKALQQTLFEEMRGRIKEDDSSVPAIDGPYAYYSRYRQGGEYPIFARRAAETAFDDSADETILFDGDAEGKEKTYFDIGNISHSPDHALLAYAIDDQGSEFYTLKIRNIETGEDLPDEITNTTGDFVWNATSDAIFWVERDDNGRPVAVHQHRLGEEGSTEVYREPDAGFFVGVSTSESDDYIYITTNDHTTSEWRFFPADATEPEPTLVAVRENGVQYSLSHQGDHFYIVTNRDDAVDFKLMKTAVATPAPDNWTDVVPHRPGTLLLDVIAFRNHLVRTERNEGLPRIVILNTETDDSHTIAFDEAAYDVDSRTGYEFDTDTVRFQYSSPSTPDQVFDYNMETRDRALRKTREVPSGHNPEDYVVERIMAPAHDGELIPITLLRHASTPVDGSAPVLLYGYGSYGITIDAGFRTSRLSLVDRGFIYAIAHIRGSMAKGYQWYLDGKLEKKENTFKDFISAGRYLVAEGYTQEGRLVGMGGSAGGLLMGAAANMDPELFGGIIAAVPFVDVLNTMSDESLPLTPPEWPEWGNPITDAEAYDTILAYSPYDQVTNRPYPPMLITGGLTDPRVTYWEPAKWAAKLRHEAPDAGPYFLKINMGAGHGGASGRFEGLKETALEYAFALAAVDKVDDYTLD